MPSLILPLVLFSAVSSAHEKNPLLLQLVSHGYERKLAGN
jgi:hypothetical protein